MLTLGRKAIESLKPGENEFDVIIIDEASQSDISSLAISYLGKKMIVVGDDKQVKRLILNCFCEFLSEIKGLRKDFDEFSQMISVCSADKLADFFKELHSNVAKEEKRLELRDKIAQSHKKSSKKSKKSSQNDKNAPKSVK